MRERSVSCLLAQKKKNHVSRHLRSTKSPFWQEASLGLLLLLPVTAFVLELVLPKRGWCKDSVDRQLSIYRSLCFCCPVSKLFYIYYLFIFVCGYMPGHVRGGQGTTVEVGSFLSSYMSWEFNLDHEQCRHLYP